MTEVAGRVAVVTGGGNGIGRGLAMAVAAKGASVIVCDIIKENAEAVATEIRKAGGEALAVACDVSDRASVRRMKADANEAFGEVSLVFANAGATALDRMNGITDHQVDWIVQVNFMGVSNCVQIFLPDMIAARGGHIVATSSMAGLIPSLIADHVPYSASKAGIIGLILNLRCEIAEFGVGATVLCPGGVKTQIMNSPRYRPARFGGATDEQVTDQVTSSVAIDKDLFRPAEEVAQMVLLAVRENRPMVTTDANYRVAFLDQYVNIVLQAFDDAATFDARPKAIDTQGEQ